MNNAVTSELMLGGWDQRIIGRPQEAHIGDKNHIVWQRLHEATSWSLTMMDLRLGNDGGSSICTDTYKAVIDTGKQGMYLPEAQFSAFKDEAKKWKGVTCPGNYCSYAPDANNACTGANLKPLYA
jgi:hypothetical protein